MLRSHHIGATEDFQEFNPGVFLTWERDLDYSIGLFYNSYSEVSVLGSVGYNVEAAPDLFLGAFAGIALYPGDGDRFNLSVGDFIPIVGLQARYRNFFTQIIPSDGETTDGVLTFGLSFDLP